MTHAVQQWLYQLLPAHLRGLDAAEGGPIADLFALIAEQIADLREDLDQRYDDLFIETCAAWVVPYIAELVGHDADFGSRAEVARTLGYRRRKGAASVLPDICRDASGWPVRCAEALDTLATAEHLDLPRALPRCPDLRRWLPLDRLAGPFATTPRTADLRDDRAHNLSDVRVFVWRARPRSLRGVDALAAANGTQFSCDPTGRDTPLWSRPLDEPGPLASPEHVPAPISRRELFERLAVHYGPGRSVAIRVAGAPVPIDLIDVADLSGARQARPGRVALDPVLGRLRFPAPTSRVEVDCHTGALAEIGGGQGLQGRVLDGAPDRVVRRGDDLGQALAALLALPAGPPRILEIADSATYTLPAASLLLPPGATLVVRAAARERPLVRLVNDLDVAGDRATLELDGVWLTGALSVATTDLRLVLRDTTLVPRVDLPSVILRGNASLTATRSVLGPVHAEATTRTRLRACIVDGAATTRPAFVAPFYPAGADLHGLPVRPPALPAGGALELDACTVIGQVSATAIDRADATIFHADPTPNQPAVIVARRQSGRLRACCVPAGSVVPPQVRPVPPGLVPAFTSLRFGAPGYAELSPSRCPPEILTGADDQSELGAFHDLHNPRREHALRARLGEYLRLGLRAGLIFAT